MPEDPRPQRTEPKSSERIRAALQSVRREPSETAAAGPQQAGIGGDDKFALAAFHQTEHAQRFQARLLDAGIMSAREASRGETRVLVDYADRERARNLLEEHLRETPNVRPPRAGRDFDFALFGGLIGMVLGLILVVDQLLGVMSLTAPLVSTVIGASMGLEIDWLRNGFRRHGRLQFGVREFLVLVVIPPLVLLFFRLLPMQLQ